MYYSYRAEDTVTSMRMRGKVCGGWEGSQRLPTSDGRVTMVGSREMDALFRRGGTRGASCGAFLRSCAQFTFDPRTRGKCINSSTLEACEGEVCPTYSC